MTQTRRDDHRNADITAALSRYRPLFGEFVDDWDGFIATLMRPLATCLWNNPLRCDGSSFARLLAAEGVEYEPIAWRDRSDDCPSAAEPEAFRLPSSFKAGQRWWYCAGLAHAQEEVSQLPVTLMDLASGHRVLDLCAAPGGKTAQIALALGNHGTVLANDFSPERIAALQGNLDRLGIVNVSTTWCDGGNYPTDAGAFDRILVDAPCSSEGTLRRNRSLAVRLGTERSVRMTSRQRALLRKAVQLCRPGGRIVYSTCTFAPEENELIVADMLDEQAGRLRLLPVQAPGLITGAGITRWHGRSLDPSLASCIRIWPHLNDTGGFFVAVLEKATDAPGLPIPAPAALTAEGDEHWIDELTEHYGLPADAWQDYRIHRQTRRGLHLAAADHAPPAVPVPQGSGLFVHRTNIRPPKLTTAGALLLGPRATRNWIELTAGQRDAYLRRQDQTPEPGQLGRCRPGHVLVRYRGLTLGIAILHRSGSLQSLFPTRWSSCAAGS